MEKESVYFLKTERLLVRRFIEDDLDNLAVLLGDQEVMKYYPSVLDREGARKWLESILENYRNQGMGWWSLHLKETEEFIGQAGLFIRELEGTERCMLGYMLHRKFQGKGYVTEAIRGIATYALDTFGIEDIYVLIRPENAESQAVAKRFGLPFEKRLMYKGYEHDVYVMHTHA